MSFNKFCHEFEIRMMELARSPDVPKVEIRKVEHPDGIMFVGGKWDGQRHKVQHEAKTFHTGYGSYRLMTEYSINCGDPRWEHYYKAIE